MSSTSPPGLPDQPSVFRRYGCLIILVTIATLVVVGAMLAYHALVGTALPYRMFASMLQKANPNLQIEGITGDLKTGLGVASITWGDEPRNPSQILDLRIRYNGFEEAGKTHRVVITDVGVRKAHIDLADFPSGNTTTYQTTTVTSNSGSGTTSVSTSTTTSSGGFSVTRPASPGLAFPNGLESFEIAHVSLEDVLITNRHTDFRLSIPKIDWTGFKLTPTGLEPGTLNIESDRLTLHTSPGRTVSIDGQEVAFQKMFTGTAQPALHPAIKQPISFTADVTFLQYGEMRPVHLTAADGKLEINGTRDGGGSVHARQLDLAGLLDPRKLFGERAADLPSDLVLSAVATSGYGDGQGTCKIIGGSFRLGASTFQIQPVEFTKAEQSHAVLEAVLKTAAGEISWALPLGNFGNEYQPRFIKSTLAPEEILARVFAGKSSKELSAEEKQAVESRLPVYFPPTEK